MVLALLMLLGGCHWATNPDARFERHELLLYPDGCFDLRIHGVESFADLRARSDGAVVTQELIQRETWREQRIYSKVCGVVPGVAEVQLLNGRDVVDSVSVEVADVESLTLAAAQDEYPEEYPAVPRPVGLLVGRRALLHFVAAGPDGRPFDLFFEDVFDVVIEPPVEVAILAGGLLIEPRSIEPGVFPVGVMGREEVRTVELVVVAPEDIEHIEVAGVVNGEGGGGYSVTGVTSDGFHILGLDAELTINGVARESEEGRWLFRGLAPGLGVSVVARWNGLEATLE
ncbi:MAG: hypothetical protein IPL19_30390 [Sandaracinaceae bacterium]|nr:hypothetical protein [Sandaracinaceae bacterium]